MTCTVFKEINFISIHCKKSKFTDCIFINMKFTGVIKNSEFINCSFSICEFDNVDFTNCIFTKCIFIRPYFRNSNLYVIFDHCILDDSIFQSSTLPVDNYDMFKNCKIHKYKVSMCSHHDGQILFEHDLKNHLYKNENIN